VHLVVGQRAGVLRGELLKRVAEGPRRTADTSSRTAGSRCTHKLRTRCARVPSAKPSSHCEGALAPTSPTSCAVASSVAPRRNAAGKPSSGWPRAASPAAVMPTFRNDVGLTVQRAAVVICTIPDAGSTSDRRNALAPAAVSTRRTK